MAHSLITQMSFEAILNLLMIVSLEISAEKCDQQHCVSSLLSLRKWLAAFCRGSSENRYFWDRRRKKCGWDSSWRLSLVGNCSLDQSTSWLLLQTNLQVAVGVWLSRNCLFQHHLGAFSGLMLLTVGLCRTCWNRPTANPCQKLMMWLR